MVAVGDLLQRSVVGQVVQALFQDVARDTQTLLELIEAGDPQERVTHDQHRPPLPHHLEALGHRAVHAGEALSFHMARIEGCIIERNAL